jgi:hypothetical protein
VAILMSDSVLVRSIKVGRRRTSSPGYKSLSESRGMCSVKAKVFIPREMAVLIISSRLFCAWPGQNWPEWLCIEKAIMDMYRRGSERRFRKGTGL